MSSFTQKLAYSKIGNNLYITEYDFDFYIDDSLCGEYVYIPGGTMFNGASIPQIIQNIFNLNPVDKRWLQATVLHDGMVNEHGQQLLIYSNGVARIPTWMESAKWFNKALAIKKCPTHIRIAFYYAVILYGLIKNKK